MNSSRNKKWEDPIVAEVHEIRRQIMAEYDNDLGKYLAALMRRQEQPGRKLVSFAKRKRRGLRRTPRRAAGVKAAK